MFHAGSICSIWRHEVACARTRKVKPAVCQLVSDKPSFDRDKTRSAGASRSLKEDLFRLGAAARGQSNRSTAGTRHTGFRDGPVSAGAEGFDDRRLIPRQSPRQSVTCYLSVRRNAHASNSGELAETTGALMPNQRMNWRASPQIVADSPRSPSLFLFGSDRTFDVSWGSRKRECFRFVREICHLADIMIIACAATIRIGRPSVV